MKYTDNGAVPSTTSELDENKHYLMPEYGSDEIFATLTNVPNGAIIMWSSDNSSVFEVEATGVKEEPSEVNAYCTISALRFDAAVA